jgi:hypothetical protein
LKDADAFVGWKDHKLGIHRPAAHSENAGSIIYVTPKIENGTALLFDAQMAALRVGRIYVNIHTEKFRGAEVRSQVER